MNFPREAQIERVAAKDELRPVLMQPWLDADEGMLVAANGFALAAVPVECDGNDVTGPMPIDALKYARKKTIKSETPEITAGRAELAFADMKMERQHMGDFPNYRELLDKAKNHPGQHFAIALNAEYLLQIAKAIGAVDGCVIVDFALDPAAPMYVRSLSAANEGEGALMPVRVQGRVGLR